MRDDEGHSPYSLWRNCPQRQITQAIRLTSKCYRTSGMHPALSGQSNKVWSGYCRGRQWHEQENLVSRGKDGHRPGDGQGRQVEGMSLP